MNRDPMNFFTLEDADAVMVGTDFIIIDKANALIREALGAKLTGLNKTWNGYKCKGDTHEAHLFCVKEIGK